MKYARAYLLHKFATEKMRKKYGDIMTARRIKAMILIHVKGCAAPYEIRLFLGVPFAYINAELKPLEERGYIEFKRWTDHPNAKVKYFLTDSGLNVLNTFDRLLKKAEITRRKDLRLTKREPLGYPKKKKANTPETPAPTGL